MLKNIPAHYYLGSAIELSTTLTLILLQLALVSVITKPAQIASAITSAHAQQSSTNSFMFIQLRFSSQVRDMTQNSEMLPKNSPQAGLCSSLLLLVQRITASLSHVNLAIR
jgi:hypothetical protein